MLYSSFLPFGPVSTIVGAAFSILDVSTYVSSLFRRVFV